LQGEALVDEVLASVLQQQLLEVLRRVKVLARRLHTLTLALYKQTVCANVRLTDSGLKRRVANVSCSQTACDWTTGRTRSHTNSKQLTGKWGIGGDNVATRHLLLRHENGFISYSSQWLDWYHALQMYRHDVVAGSK